VARRGEKEFSEYANTEYANYSQSIGRAKLYRGDVNISQEVVAKKPVVMNSPSEKNLNDSDGKRSLNTISNCWQTNGNRS
jgi:hypothetical protein